MLALLERLVTDAGGTWVFCDTDSMAIVTTTDGALIPATGGHHRLVDGSTAVRALSDDQLDGILGRFAQLNPYNRDAVRGTILRRVDNGRGHAYAISAKRYAIYNPKALAAHCHSHAAGQPSRRERPILKRSEHGLGHLLNPLHPDDIDNRNWIDELWTIVLAHQAGLPVPWPDWIDRPALSRYTVTSPHLWGPFKPWNTDRPWDQQVKPFNFMLVAHVARGDRPIAATDDFQLLAPYTNQPGQWTQLNWIDRADPGGEPWRISNENATDDAGHTVVVQTYADVLTTFRKHPEAKYSDVNGRPCTAATVGVLQRRQIRPSTASYIGKEADKIDEVRAGLVTTTDEVITTYDRIDDFHDVVLPAIAHLSAQQVAERIAAQHPGYSKRAVQRAVQRSRQGATPRQDLRQAISDLALVESARGHPVYAGRPLAQLSPNPPLDDGVRRAVRCRCPLCVED